MTRCFIALDLPRMLRDALERAAEPLQHTSIRASWVPPEQYHVTLRFLGPLDDATLTDVTERLAQVRAYMITASLGTLGTFGTPPRVLWASLSGTEPIHDAVDDALGPRYAADKPFVSHITLARVKDSHGLPDLRHVPLDETPHPIRSFSLKRSVLTRTGAAHTVLATYPLLPR